MRGRFGRINRDTPIANSPTSGVKKKQVTKAFQNGTPSCSILFAVIAQAISHKRPAIPIVTQTATTAKCTCENILAPKKIPANPTEAPNYSGLIVNVVAEGEKD
jgi:hypothetical protein